MDETERAVRLGEARAVRAWRIEHECPHERLIDERRLCDPQPVTVCADCGREVVDGVSGPR